MNKQFLYVVVSFLFFAGVVACNEIDAGLMHSPSEEIDPDGVVSDTTEQEDPENPYEDEVLGDIHTIERVAMPDGYWAQIRVWPGVPGDSSIETRWANVPVTIDAVYTKRNSSDRFGGIGNTPWFSTGLYAPPAEMITIVKPASLRGRRVVCRIGSSNCTLGDKQKPWKRLSKTFTTQVLADDTTRMYNYCGGNIYMIPDQPFSKPEVFMISGAIKSPDFILGKTDARKWKEEIAQTTVPFAEISGKRVIWSMPTGDGYLKSVVDPVELMEFYDQIVLHDYYEFHGVSESSFNTLHRAPTFPSRHVPDIQVCAGAAHAGYPCMYGLNYASRGVKLEMMKYTGNAWGFYHELGHNYQVATWKWGVLGEVSNNFHIMHSHNRQFGKWVGTEGYQELIDAYTNAVPVAERDFDSQEYEDILNHTTRLIPFFQLAQQFGWKLYAYLSTKARELPGAIASTVSSTDANRRDFFCISACEYAGVDLREFYSAWGIRYSSRASGVMSKLPPYSGAKFWEKWDITLIGDTKTARTPNKIDDFTYGMKGGEVDRRLWTVLEEESVHIFTSSPAMNLFDGKNDTYWSSERVNRPIFNIQPVIVVDMKMSNSIDYIEYLHRQDISSNMFKCKQFKVEVRDYYADPWEEVGTFELTDAMNLQRFEFNKTHSAQYLRITFMNGLQGGADGEVCAAEIKVGKSTE